VCGGLVGLGDVAVYIEVPGDGRQSELHALQLLAQDDLATWREHKRCLWYSVKM